MESQPTAPGRTRLLALARRYLDAVAAGRPGDVELAGTYRATENGSAVDPGEGLWQDAQSFSDHSTLLCDEISSEVVVFGVVNRSGPQPLALRLRFGGDSVDQAEAIVSSSTQGFFADVTQLMKSDPIYDAPIPEGRSCTREELRAVADSYWTALGQSDGSLVDVHYRADRFANGKKVTNNLEILLSPDKAVHSVASLLTATRPARPEVRERRFPVLDVARGVAASIALVDFADDPRNPRPDTGCFYIMNLLKVVDRQIRIIDAIHQILPRGTPSGWDSEDAISTTAEAV